MNGIAPTPCIDPSAFINEVFCYDGVFMLTELKVPLNGDAVIDSVGQ